jgi:hypothetical protein
MDDEKHDATPKIQLAEPNRFRCKKDGKEHIFKKTTIANLPKDKKQKQIKICQKCGIDEWKAEICKNCRFFIPNNLVTPIPQAGLSDRGYCSKHKMLFDENQVSCRQFVRFVAVWKKLFGLNGDKNGEEEDPEMESWKKKQNKTEGENKE